MYSISDSEAQLIEGAQRLALARMKLPPNVCIDQDFARQFLVREILRLIGEGESNMQALANHSLGRLREHIQIRQSAQRLTSMAD
jgi:hypothetical protein